MSAESTLILFGLLTIVTPFLGLPHKWYGYIFSIIGLVVLGIGISLRMRVRTHSQNQPMQGSQSESPEISATDEARRSPSPIA